jgi:hypothetical protein
VRRIAEVAREVVQGGELSERARAAMAKDLEIFETQKVAQQSTVTQKEQFSKRGNKPAIEMAD